MFDKYIIVPEGFRNTTSDSAVDGYELGIRLPYYRGLGLSMVESIDLTVDGTSVPTDSLTLTVHGNSYAVTELSTVFDDRWEMGEIATLRVAQPGGLPAGTHEVSVAQRLRISYMPVPGGGRDTKTLQLFETTERPDVYQLSANIELLFNEAGPDYADRVRAAAAAGFDAVEMWGTFEKDLDSLGAALRETGVALTSVLAEPRTNFTLPWETDRTPFLDGLARGVDNARLLGSPRIVVGSGIGFPGMKRVQNLQKLIDAYGLAVERIAGSGVTMILEPVNSRVDHPGTLIDRTADAVTVAEAVNDDSFKILYDLYHSVTEGEDPATELATAGELIGYVQFADVVGRGEPGSGTIDWPAALKTLDAAGYVGPIGLEYIPTQATAESVRYIRSVAAAA